MRRHIAKNMQTRSSALRNAIQVYNAAAAAMTPPRPKLDWDTVSHYHLLQEFELLNDTQADIREKVWAQPAVRETMRRARRVARAHEEIAIVNAEARSVHTSIRDEEILFVAVLSHLERAGDRIYGAMLEYITRRRAANAHVLATLKKLYELPGFTGNPKPGRRVGGPPVAPSISRADLENVPVVVSGAGGEQEQAGGDEEDLEDDIVQDELSMLTDFVGALSTS